MDIQDYNRKIIADFRADRAAGKAPLDGRSLLLLTTTGAKSGQPRITPLMYIPDDPNIILIASNNGAQQHPDWYHNIAAHPEVTIEVGKDTYTLNAIVTRGDQRRELWDKVTAQYPFFREHQANTSREIPVILLPLPTP